jgi:hypothetical protein
MRVRLISMARLLLGNFRAAAILSSRISVLVMTMTKYPLCLAYGPPRLLSTFPDHPGIYGSHPYTRCFIYIPLESILNNDHNRENNL